VSDHVSEDLVALLRGELSPIPTRAVASHLHTCGECTSELIAVAVAHGSLVAAARAEAELAPQIPRSVPEASPASLIDAGAEQPPLRFRPRRYPHIRMLVAAAAAVLIVGGGTALGLTLSHPGSKAPVVALVTLAALETPSSAQGSAVVTAVGTTRDMSISTAGLPPPPANDFYEVWLLQPATNKMLPVGVLSPSGTGSYALSASVMGQFSAVDVSLQANNGNPAHSDTSVLRGLVHPQPT